MSPDSPASKIARLEERADSQDKNLELLGQFLREQAVLADRYGRLKEDVASLAGQLRDLETRLDRAKEERDRERQRVREREEAREERDRKERWLKWTTIISLILVFAGTLATVLTVLGHTP